MMKIRTLIVDDEPLARRGIRAQLKTMPDIEVIGEAANGREAVAFILEQKTDLVFLDVQMPILNGFGVIEKLGAKNMPTAVVFVTAFDEHAIRAFEINALDYLLKPLDPARFQKTIERAREQIKNSNARVFERKLTSLLQTIEPREESPKPAAYLERITVKQAERIVFLNVSEITRIISEGNYVCLHAKNETHLLRETMDKVEQKLNPKDFVRLRRSTIVRIDQIKEMYPLFNGEYEVVLKSGARISSSRRYRKNLEGLLHK